MYQKLMSTIFLVFSSSESFWVLPSVSTTEKSRSRAGQGVADLGLVALGHARKNGHVLVALLQGDLGHTQSVGGGVVDQILQGVIGVDVDVDIRELQTACGLDRDGVLGLGLGASGLGLVGGDGLGGLAGGLIGFGGGVAGGEGRQQHEHRQNEGEGLAQILHFSSPIKGFVHDVCDGLQRSIKQHPIAYHKPREKSRGFLNFLQLRIYVYNLLLNYPSECDKILITHGLFYVCRKYAEKASER